MIKGFKKWKHQQDFNPGFFGLFLNPFFIARKGLWNNMKMLAPLLKGDLLDVGCGRKPYKSLFTVSKYLGLDIENPGHSHEGEDVDVFYDGRIFPFDDSSFDSVLCNQVLEHVFNPEEFLSEIHRVLKPGGKLLLTVPFAWDEHEQPFDFARYSSFGLKHLLEKVQLRVEQHVKSVNTASAVFQLWITYLYKVLLTKSGFVNLLAAIIFLAPFTVTGLFWGLVLPRNNDFYLDNIIVASKEQFNAQLLHPL